jgi:hypothetical protein
MLESHLRRAELEQLLHTRRYWARQMVGNEGWLTGQVKVELNACREALGEMADEARELERRWGMVCGVIVVPDAHLLLRTTEFFDDLDWRTALDITGSVPASPPPASLGEFPPCRVSIRTQVRLIERQRSLEPSKFIAMSQNCY